MLKTNAALAVAILGLIAITGYSQAQTVVALAPSPGSSGSAVASPTPNPNAGTYRDATLSLPQRLALADADVTSGTDPAVANVASWMLQQRPVGYLMTAFPAFAPSVASDPTLKGAVTDTNANAMLFASAVLFEAGTNSVLANQIAFLASNLGSPSLNPAQALRLKAAYAILVSSQAKAQYASGDYAGAITTATAVLGYGDSGAIDVVFQSKIALRAPDVLSWAKLIYTVVDFGHTQSGIDAVSSAYRSIDCNVSRANAFIAFQTSGTGTNPLASVPLPTGFTFIQAGAPQTALNYGLTGDNLAALKTAVSSFATAASGNPLNVATAFVAQWLRNIDGNLVRANAFVQAQSQGLPYTIAELSGTSGN